MIQRTPLPREQRIKLLMATTPKLAAEGWLDIGSVPKDREVEIRVVNAIAADCDNPDAEGYIATARAHWIDHNGGGLTWHGLAGAPSQWRPVREAK